MNKYEFKYDFVTVGNKTYQFKNGKLKWIIKWQEEENMTNITVYDIEAKELERIADANDTTIAEVVEMLMDYVEEMKKDNGLK